MAGQTGSTYVSETKTDTAISNCRLLSQSYGNTFELAMVVKLHFVSTVTTILILDLICNISQHDHEISPVEKLPHVFSSFTPECDLTVNASKNHLDKF